MLLREILNDRNAKENNKRTVSSWRSVRRVETAANGKHKKPSEIPKLFVNKSAFWSLIERNLSSNRNSTVRPRRTNVAHWFWVDFYSSNRPPSFSFSSLSSYAHQFSLSLAKVFPRSFVHAEIRSLLTSSENFSLPTGFVPFFRFEKATETFFFSPENNSSEARAHLAVFNQCN